MGFGTHTQRSPDSCPVLTVFDGNRPKYPLAGASGLDYAPVTWPQRPSTSVLGPGAGGTGILQTQDRSLRDQVDLGDGARDYPMSSLDFYEKRRLNRRSRKGGIRQEGVGDMTTRTGRSPRQGSPGPWTPTVERTSRTGRDSPVHYSSSPQTGTVDGEWTVEVWTVVTRTVSRPVGGSNQCLRLPGQ